MQPITTKSIGIDGDVFEDRRREPRQRVLKGATLTFNRGYGALECVVRNRSDGGAKLAFGDTAAVPARFLLKIAGEDEALEARVCWRTMSNIGVAFSSSV